MKKIHGVILFTAIIVILVAIVVFGTGNNPPSISTGSQNPGSVQAITPNTTTGSQELKVSRSNLSIHNSQQDCWVGFEGKVYDITDWLPRHPGSAGAIVPYCGTSTEFESAFEGQHGRAQVERLLKEGVYKGDLE